MIEIQIQQDQSNNAYRVHMEGHANYDETGKDIICAGASTLCLTLAKCLEENVKCLSSEPKIEIEDGLANIEWSVYPQYIHSMVGTLYTVKTGFKVLSDMYPDYVRLI